jgi:hypothetical protein
MSRILCAYSGIEFQVEHFPHMYLTSRECFHPIFTLSSKKLLATYSHKWADGELTETENYLLYLALLNSTDRIEWRVPAIRTSLTSSIIAKNMYALIQIVGKIDLASNNPALNLPYFVISPDTKDLSTSGDWIKIWNENWDDFQNGYRSSILREKISRREQALERFIKDKNKPVESYAGILAEWACDAAEFPLFLVTYDGKEMTCAEYWKMIIRKCARSESIFSISDTDLDELIEHCEEHLDIQFAGIFSHSVMFLLREGRKRKQNFLGLGEFVPLGTTYTMVEEGESVQTSNVKALISAAPSKLPVKEDYPSLIAYLRAKAAYDVAIMHAENKTVVEQPDRRLDL